MESASSKEESHSVVEEEEVRFRRRRISKVAEKKAEVSSSCVFTLFDEGLTPTEVVKQLANADPIVIRDWYKTWVDMNSSRVFMMFDEGLSPMDVVKNTNADSLQIRDLFRRWVEMKEDWRWWRERERGVKVVEEKIVQLKKAQEAYLKSLIKGLEVEADEKLEQLKRQLGSDEVIKLQGRKPSGLKAAMCYIIARERGLSNVITQTRLSEYYEITTQTVLKNVKTLGTAYAKSS